MDFAERVLYIVNHSRELTIRSGFDPDKQSVSTAKPGDSIFKGISKAKPARPLDHADMGLFHVVITSREYDNRTFTAPTIEEATTKAADWISEQIGSKD